ncbi:MAG: hypothetical protein ACE5K4_06730 [Candidatus Hydrothermarchaeota archaeon]
MRRETFIPRNRLKIISVLNAISKGSGLFILEILKENQPMSIIEIENLLVKMGKKIGQSYTGKSVDRLCRLGLIEKTDRGREKELTLTQLGEKVLVLVHDIEKLL